MSSLPEPQVRRWRSVSRPKPRVHSEEPPTTHPQVQQHQRQQSSFQSSPIPSAYLLPTAPQSEPDHSHSYHSVPSIQPEEYDDDDDNEPEELRVQHISSSRVPRVQSIVPQAGTWGEWHDTPEDGSPSASPISHLSPTSAHRRSSSASSNPPLVSPGTHSPEPVRSVATTAAPSSSSPIPDETEEEPAISNNQSKRIGRFFMAPPPYIRSPSSASSTSTSGSIDMATPLHSPTAPEAVDLTESESAPQPSQQPAAYLERVRPPPLSASSPSSSSPRVPFVSPVGTETGLPRGSATFSPTLSANELPARAHSREPSMWSSSSGRQTFMMHSPLTSLYATPRGTPTPPSTSLNLSEDDGIARALSPEEPTPTADPANGPLTPWSPQFAMRAQSSGQGSQGTQGTHGTQGTGCGPAVPSPSVRSTNFSRPTHVRASASVPHASPPATPQAPSTPLAQQTFQASDGARHPTGSGHSHSLSVGAQPGLVPRVGTNSVRSSAQSGRLRPTNRPPPVSGGAFSHLIPTTRISHTPPTYYSTLPSASAPTSAPAHPGAYPHANHARSPSAPVQSLYPPSAPQVRTTPSPTPSPKPERTVPTRSSTTKFGRLFRSSASNPQKEQEGPPGRTHSIRHAFGALRRKARTSGSHARAASSVEPLYQGQETQDIQHNGHGRNTHIQLPAELDPPVHGGDTSFATLGSTGSRTFVSAPSANSSPFPSVPSANSNTFASAPSNSNTFASLGSGTYVTAGSAASERSVNSTGSLQASCRGRTISQPLGSLSEGRHEGDGQPARRMHPPRTKTTGAAGRHEDEGGAGGSNVLWSAVRRSTSLRRNRSKSNRSPNTAAADALAQGAKPVAQPVAQPLAQPVQPQGEQLITSWDPSPAPTEAATAPAQLAPTTAAQDAEHSTNGSTAPAPTSITRSASQKLKNAWHQRKRSQAQLAEAPNGPTSNTRSVTSLLAPPEGLQRCTSRSRSKSQWSFGRSRSILSRTDERRDPSPHVPGSIRSESSPSRSVLEESPSSRTSRAAAMDYLVPRVVPPHVLSLEFERPLTPVTVGTFAEASALPTPPSPLGVPSTSRPGPRVGWPHR